jgi:hypothetical protein
MRSLLDNLEEAEMNLNQVVATNVYLNDLLELRVFNPVYKSVYTVFWSLTAGANHGSADRTHGAQIG